MKFSKMMLGTVQFGLNYGIANTAGKPAYETAREIIKVAYENGINCLDTAAGYGDSEEVIGRALTELRLNDKMQIISKVDKVYLHNFTPTEAEKFITGSVEKSLRRLRIDRLAVCLFHVEADLQYLEVLQKLEQRNLIGGMGISLDTNTHCSEVISRKLKYIQLPCNIFDRRFNDFFAKVPDNTHIFSRSAYLQGLLLMPEEKIKTALSCIIPVRRKIEDLARAAGMNMSELCFRFVLTNPRVSSVLVGVDSVEQLKQNLATIEKGPLSEDLYQQIAAIVPAFEEKIIRPGLWERV
jgi:aryl-alcohol dehydrogenase-like predicted oxidoreductase